MSANQPMPSYGIAEEFPLMWEIAQQHDFAERLGGCTEPLWHEIDAALRELWDARRAALVSAADNRQEHP